MSIVPNCSICKELFQTSEDIQATNCGHIFHTKCWKTISDEMEKCPQCEEEKVTLTNVFLHFEKSELKPEIDAKIESIPEIELENAKKQLEACEKEIKDMEKDMSEENESAEGSNSSEQESSQNARSFLAKLALLSMLDRLNR